jgi:NADP-dependent 3-hydroxy acid dehydrogenase YdfG
MPWRSIEGKTAVVTGATSGIGRETALALSAAGAKVMLAGRRLEKLEALAGEIMAAGRVAAWQRTDVSSRADVRALIDSAVDRFGTVDILVNNAGSGMFARIEETDIDAFRTLMDTNFWGVVYGCEVAVPVMRRQPTRGLIMNVASIAGKRGMPLFSAYCATKFAVAGYSESLRAELAMDGIEVTTVFPGLVDTEFSGAARNDTGLPMPATIPGLPAAALAQALVANARFPQRELVLAGDAQLIQLVNTVAPWALDAFQAGASVFLPRRT